jgi:hypothetical protein
MPLQSPNYYVLSNKTATRITAAALNCPLSQPTLKVVTCPGMEFPPGLRLNIALRAMVSIQLYSRNSVLALFLPQWVCPILLLERLRWKATQIL